MKPLPKVAAIAGILGDLVFAVVFAVNYLHLLAHQPPHEPGQPWPADVTSFPPSVAWVVALPFGFCTFVGVFFLGLIVLSFRSRPDSKDEAG